MKIAKVTAVIAASLIIGAASIWAQDNSSQQQSGASQQSDSQQSGAPSSSSDSGSQSSMQPGASGQPGQQMQEAAGAAIATIAQDPKSFVTMAYQDSQADIQLGQLADQKAQSQQVKDYAKELVKSNQDAIQQLKQLAQQKNIQLPEQLSPRIQSRIDQLSSASGADFDKQFMNQQVRLNKKDVALYEKAASSNSDPDVKKWAESTLPTLKQHLQTAQQQAGISEAAGAEQQGQSSQQGQQGQQGQDQQSQPQSGQDQQQQQSPQSSKPN